MFKAQCDNLWKSMSRNKITKKKKKEFYAWHSNSGVFIPFAFNYLGNRKASVRTALDIKCVFHNTPLQLMFETFLSPVNI
jgi:hypothetical protein